MAFVRSGGQHPLECVGLSVLVRVFLGAAESHHQCSLRVVPSALGARTQPVPAARRLGRRQGSPVGAHVLSPRAHAPSAPPVTSLLYRERPEDVYQCVGSRRGLVCGKVTE